MDLVDCRLVFVLGHYATLEERGNDISVSRGDCLLHTPGPWHRCQRAVGDVPRAKSRRKKLRPEHVGVVLHRHLPHFVMEMRHRRRDVTAGDEAEGRILHNLETVK